jgi:uncharacterized protein
VTSADAVQPGRGPVSPSPAAVVVHRPLGGEPARFGTGLLLDWQRRNRVSSLPLALRQLEAAGNLGNLRLAIAGAHDGYRGPVFMDSDIYKTLEAIGWELGRGGDRELADFAEETTALLEKAQQPDGYLNSAVQVSGQPRYGNLASSHEMYCAGHLIQAGIAYRRAVGSDRLLGVARRFADHLVDTFLGKGGGLDGHPIVETALVELYRETGRRPYLELASQWIEQRGHGLIGDSGFGLRYLQDHEPVREATTEVGHVVRALYLEAGVVDVAAETGDAALLHTSLTRWADMIAAKTYLTGGNGSRHEGESFGDRFELPPDRAYNETCAAIASFQWAWRLLLATGEGRYADHMERVLYNGFAGAIAASGTRFFYVNPLQRRAGHFEKDDPGRRHDWFSCACCPPNIMRLMASLQYYLATVAGDTLYVHQFTGAVVAAPLAGGELAVRLATSYPWSGMIEVEVTSAPPEPAGLALRVPGWSRQRNLMVNGQLVPVRSRNAGYLELNRRWQVGDVLTYQLDATPRLTLPDRRIDAVRGTAAIERGPLVYCFEQVDQPVDTDLEDLALIPGRLGERVVTVPDVGPSMLIEAAALRRHDRSHPTPRASGLPYRQASNASAVAANPAGELVVATAIPYFQWDNRDGRAMQVWLPLAQAAVNSQAADEPEEMANQGGESR